MFFSKGAADSKSLFRGHVILLISGQNAPALTSLPGTLVCLHFSLFGS